MFKRSQQDVSDSSKHWYQDKYQHVLTQRNVLALIAIISLIAAAVGVIAVMRLAPLKTVEPYLLQIDEKSGLTRRVEPISKDAYAASEAVDRYFTATYLRLRESYSINTLRTNYNIVRLMSTPEVFGRWRLQLDPTSDFGYVKRLGSLGQREVRIRSMVYISAGDMSQPTRSKIMQARITTTETLPNKPDIIIPWLVTVTFEYANLSLNDEEAWLNPLGYTVTTYQMQREIE